MNFTEITDVSQGKIDALRERMARLGIRVEDIVEQFTKGGGKGGQKINKTSNRVVLLYPPHRLVVRCQRERRRSLNRFLALRELVDQVELIISPRTSPRRKEWERIRRQKDRRSRRRNPDTGEIPGNLSE